MTSPFAGPGRQAPSGPGLRPVARSGDQPSRSPGIRQRTGAPQRALDRGTMATSTVLAWWRLFVVLACLVVAVVVPLVLENNRGSLDQVNQSAQQLLRLQAVRGDVLAADAAAASEVANAEAGGQIDQRYLDLLSEASGLLADASAARPEDRTELIAVNSALTRYVAELAEGTGTLDAEQMGEAFDRMNTDLLPILDQQIELNQERLATSIADQRWLSALVALPILVLLAASVIVARRTRRVLNVGLVIALLLTGLVMYSTTTLVTTSARSVGLVQTGDVVQATSASQAYSAVTEAKRWEARILLGTVDPASGNAAFTAVVDQARQSLEQVTEAQQLGLTNRLDDMVSAHDALLAAGEDPVALARARSDSDTAYNALVEWLPQYTRGVGANLDSQLRGQANQLGNSTWQAAAAMLLAALAGGIGVSQPLRRYR